MQESTILGRFFIQYAKNLKEDDLKGKMNSDVQSLLSSKENLLRMRRDQMRSALHVTRQGTLVA